MTDNTPCYRVLFLCYEMHNLCQFVYICATYSFTEWRYVTIWMYNDVFERVV